MLEFISQPWPWYVAGPLIGLTVPALLLLGNKAFGISGNLRSMCAMLPTKVDFFQMDWRAQSWNLMFVLGVTLGGLISATLMANPDPIALSQATVSDLAMLGITDTQGLVPTDLFSWSSLATIPGFVLIVVGGFLVGFGSRWAGGCTSGHAITGLAELQFPSLIAVVGFFAGGLLVTYIILPILL